jgi:hypothetical protein
MLENQLQQPKLQKVTCRLLIDSIYNKIKGAIVVIKHIVNQLDYIEG